MTSPESKEVDVLVAGAGAGGICAAVAAARTGAKVLLLEKADEVGGTGVHSPVSLICKFHARDHRAINLGIHRELFPHVYIYSTWDQRPSAPRLTYDEKSLLSAYKRLLAAEDRLEIATGEGVKRVEMSGTKILGVETDLGRFVKAKMFVDGTANGNLSAMAGAEFQKGREADGAMQSATLVFGMSGIDKAKLKVPDFTTRGGLDSLWAEMTALYRAAKAEGRTDNPKGSIIAFPYPDGERLLFNSNEVLGVDPTEPGSEENALKLGRRYVDDLVNILRDHPAFESARVEFVAEKMGVREGRRVVGDYVLTQEDCLGEARFDDMVAACSYEIDIHDPEGGDARMVNIPGSGYYHIPLRSLLAKGMPNLLLGSRCISGTHEAHSSYRVMSGVTAIGQAAGTAAALAAGCDVTDVREVKPSWVRHELRHQVQFVEGELEPPPENRTRTD